MRLRVLTEPAAGFKLDKSIFLLSFFIGGLLYDAHQVLYLLDHPADLGIVLVLDRLVELLQTKCLKRELLSLGALDLATYLLDLYR